MGDLKFVMMSSPKEVREGLSRTEGGGFENVRGRQRKK